MCGICGILGFEDEKLLERMCDVMHHRGPDDSGLFTDKNIGLGHRRLSIIDVEGGHQPIHNEDESIWIVYNGETYNFPELRQDLEDRGHKFYTNTDTEVLVHLYEEFGDFFVEKLNGMFGFAIWDSNKRKLLLARDRIGIKPLYYTAVAGVFLFGSEIKSILQYKEVPRRVDYQSLHYLLSLRYIPGERTMFEGIKKLLPGCILVYENGKFEVHRYWDLKVSFSHEKTENYYIKHLQKLLKEAIGRHMISDVPVGSFLSGGIDTSTIVAIASALTDKPLKTFCMGFGEPTDELDDARKVAEHFETDHHEFIIDPFEGFKLFPESIWHIDMPKTNLYPYFVSELAGKYVKVVNSGMGGDELFGGYIDRCVYTQKAERLNKTVPNPVKPMISKLASELIKLQSRYGKLEWDYTYRDYLRAIYSLGNKTSSYLILVRAFTKEDFDKLYSGELRHINFKSVEELFRPYFENNNLNFLDQTLLAEFKTKLVDDFLIVDDAMSMAHSLEMRVPFLDAELVDFSFNIPSHLKVRHGAGKYILKKAVSSIVPKYVLKKKKWGFRADPYQWFKKGLREYALQMLPDGNIIKEGYFDYDYIHRILKHPPDKRLSRHYRLIWTLLSFEIWHKIYIDNDNLYKPNLSINNFY